MGIKLRVGTLMRERGITTPGQLAAFAAQAGISPNTAKSFYHDAPTRVDLGIVNRVAKALQVRPLELFEEVDEDWLRRGLAAW